jgi:NAD(P)-dependent dehydrogenase (short-subunit alcohol dehydrogenase family)
VREVVAIVTGASSGIGAAVVRRLRADGAEVVAAGRRGDLLDALAAECGARPVLCDVREERDVQALVQRANSLGPPLGILVNAAGIVCNDDVVTIDTATWNDVMDTNLCGTMRVCRAAIPLLQRAGNGSIVNVASVAAFNGSEGMATYSASKAGVVALTRSIANRYGPFGVRANCLCPGWVRTPMSEAEVRQMAVERSVREEEVWKSLSGQIGLGRIATSEEIAACVRFLASDESSFVSGAVLVADGAARTPARTRAF